MTREQLKDLAIEMRETVDYYDEIVGSLKGGLDVMRIQIGDLVDAIDGDEGVCIEACAARLAGALRQGGRIISLAPDNWQSPMRPVKSGL